MTENTNEKEEVRDPQGLLTAYNKLKADMAQRTTEIAALQETNATLAEKVKTAGSEYRGKALNAEIRLALHNQGVKNIDTMMKYVGTDGIDFDDEGKVTGLDERLTTLKTDLPEIFDVKKRVGGRADIHANGDVNVKSNPLKEAVHAAISGNK